jgi:hypothetical protein
VDQKEGLISDHSIPPWMAVGIDIAMHAESAKQNAAATVRFLQQVFARCCDLHYQHTG